MSIIHEQATVSRTFDKQFHSGHLRQLESSESFNARGNQGVEKLMTAVNSPG
ncbi:MAG UNVERIFIED_CONTAM: hypothetical protein LVR18_41995 [Planctomycetaceae bacterium]